MQSFHQPRLILVHFISRMSYCNSVWLKSLEDLDRATISGRRVREIFCKGIRKLFGQLFSRAARKLGSNYIGSEWIVSELRKVCY